MRRFCLLTLICHAGLSGVEVSPANADEPVVATEEGAFWETLFGAPACSDFSRACLQGQLRPGASPAEIVAKPSIATPDVSGFSRWKDLADVMSDTSIRSQVFANSPVLANRLRVLVEPLPSIPGCGTGRTEAALASCFDSVLYHHVGIDADDSAGNTVEKFHLLFSQAAPIETTPTTTRRLLAIVSKFAVEGDVDLAYVASRYAQSYPGATRTELPNGIKLSLAAGSAAANIFIVKNDRKKAIVVIKVAWSGLEQQQQRDAVEAQIKSAWKAAMLTKLRADNFDEVTRYQISQAKQSIDTDLDAARSQLASLAFFTNEMGEPERGEIKQLEERTAAVAAKRKSQAEATARATILSTFLNTPPVVLGPDGVPNDDIRIVRTSSGLLLIFWSEKDGIHSRVVNPAGKRISNAMLVGQLTMNEAFRSRYSAVPLTNGDILVAGVLRDGRITFARGSPDASRQFAPKVVASAAEFVPAAVELVPAGDHVGVIALRLSKVRSKDGNYAQPGYIDWMPSNSDGTATGAFTHLRTLSNTGVGMGERFFSTPLLCGEYTYVAWPEPERGSAGRGGAAAVLRLSHAGQTTITTTRIASSGGRFSLSCETGQPTLWWSDEKLHYGRIRRGAGRLVDSARSFIEGRIRARR